MQCSMDCLDYAASKRYKCCCAKPKIYGYAAEGLQQITVVIFLIRCCLSSSFAREFCYLLAQVFTEKQVEVDRETIYGQTVANFSEFSI